MIIFSIVKYFAVFYIYHIYKEGKMERMMKMVLSGVVAGFILFIVAGISYKFTGNISDPSLKGLFRESISMNWFYKLLFINAGTGLVMAVFYSLMKDGLPFNNIMKGVAWGLVVWVVMIHQPLVTSLVVGTFSANMLLTWLAQGCVSYVAAGISIALLNR